MSECPWAGGGGRACVSLTGPEVTQGPVFDASLHPPRVGRWARWQLAWPFPSRRPAAPKWGHQALTPPSRGLSEQNCRLPLAPRTAPTFEVHLRRDFLRVWALGSSPIQGQRPADTGQGCGGHRGPGSSRSGSGGSPQTPGTKAGAACGCLGHLWAVSLGASGKLLLVCALGVLWSINAVRSPTSGH